MLDFDTVDLGLHARALFPRNVVRKNNDQVHIRHLLSEAALGRAAKEDDGHQGSAVLIACVDDGIKEAFNPKRQFRLRESRVGDGRHPMTLQNLACGVHNSSISRFC